MSKAKQADSSDSITYEAFENVERGDVIVIDGTEHPVYRLNSGLRSLSLPDHPDVVTPEGEVKSLAHGAFRDDDDRTALIYAEEVGEDEPPSEEECLTVGLENVEVRSGGECDILSLLPSTDTRECPDCGNDGGVYHFSDRDEQHTREARKCTGDDCDRHYVVNRTVPDTSATVQLRSHDGEWGEEIELSGLYREVVSSRFKMDPRSRAREGYFSAQEVAEWIETKMNNEGEAEQFGYVTGGENPSKASSVTWRDARIDQKLKVTFEPVR